MQFLRLPPLPLGYMAMVGKSGTAPASVGYQPTALLLSYMPMVSGEGFEPPVLSVNAAGLQPASFSLLDTLTWFVVSSVIFSPRETTKQWTWLPSTNLQGGQGKDPGPV